MAILVAVLGVLLLMLAIGLFMVAATADPCLALDAVGRGRLGTAESL